MDTDENIVERLKQRMEDEGISSPSEYGANTPMYILRVGQLMLEDSLTL